MAIDYNDKLKHIVAQVFEQFSESECCGFVDVYCLITVFKHI